MIVSLKSRIKRLERRVMMSQFIVYVGVPIALQNGIVISEDDEKL